MRGKNCFSINLLENNLLPGDSRNTHLFLANPTTANPQTGNAQYIFVIWIFITSFTCHTLLKLTCVRFIKIKSCHQLSWKVQTECLYMPSAAPAPHALLPEKCLTAPYCFILCAEKWLQVKIFLTENKRLFVGFLSCSWLTNKWSHIQSLR